MCVHVEAVHFYGVTTLTGIMSKKYVIKVFSFAHKSVCLSHKVA